MDVFPTEKSDCLRPVFHTGKWGPFESLMLQGKVQVFISYKDWNTNRIFHYHVPDWMKYPLYVANFKRTVSQSKNVQFFDPRVKWEKVCKKLEKPPLHNNKTTDQRLNFKMDNLLLVKRYFSFGLWTVPVDEGHVFQTTDAPMLAYHLPDDSLAATPTPNIVRRSLVKEDAYLYKRYVLRPNSTCVVPPLTRYLILTVQKTLFSVDVMAWEDVKELLDFRTHTTYTLEAYNLPPPTPAGEFGKRPKTTRSEDRLLAGTLAPFEQPMTSLDPDPGQRPTWESHESMPQNQILFFQEPVSMGQITCTDSPDQNWMNVLKRDISREEIYSVISYFEKEYGGITAPPAHRIQMDRLESNNDRFPRVSSYLPPPPPDKYWTLADPEEPSCIDSLFPVEVQEEPMDLTTNGSVGSE